jgi:lysophospholipase L1-like esterase
MAIRLRSLLGSLALSAAAVLGTILVLEAAFRLLHVSVGTVQINRATIRRTPNPQLRFELRPGAHVRAETDYRINALGLRGPETTLEKLAGTRRVAVLGDSIAFGYWVAERDAFPRQLEVMLDERRGKGGPVEVLDFGVPGYNLDQEIEVLRARALDFRPDVVVIAFCLNDLEDVFSHEFGLVEDRSVRERTLMGRAREALLSRSLLFSWIEYRMAEMASRRAFVKARNPLPASLYAGAIDRQKAALVAKFGVVRGLLAARGIPGLVVIFPALGGRFENYAYRDVHRIVSEAAATAELPTVDLLDCYSAYDFHDLRVDVVHPSPMGHRIAAHAVRDSLCAQGILCDRGPIPEPPCTAYRRSDFPTVRGY